jgi:hypothetical protein
MNWFGMMTVILRILSSSLAVSIFQPPALFKHRAMEAPHTASRGFRPSTAASKEDDARERHRGHEGYNILRESWW